MTSISGGAFGDCDNLTSVVIGDSVTSIGDYAFSECYKLVEIVNKSPHITVEKGSEDNGGVGAYALAVYNSADTFASTKVSNDNGYIVYTEGEEKILVGYIGEETDLVLPTYITKINKYAFATCDSLTSIEIPDSVTSIGNSAFRSCTNLTSVEIPDSVTSIGEGVFSFCDSLTSIEIPNGVTSIGEGVFSSCDSLTSIEIPNSVTSIGENAFSSCDNLTSIVIPDSVESIGDWVFSDCDNLTSVEIGDGVESIGDWAFYRCDKLTSITVSEDNTAYQSIDGNLYTKDGRTLEQYAVGKTATSFTIPDGVTTIGEGAFDYCEALRSVVIGVDVKVFGADAFMQNSILFYYKGTASDWEDVTIIEGDDYWFSEELLAYYIENQEDVPTDRGNYWHYVDGVPTAW